MEKYTSWSENEENKGINPLTGREEIGFPAGEQERFAKEYLHLAQEQQKITDESMGLIRKIDNLTDELHLSPDMNQKLIDAYRGELEKNKEKEGSLQSKMDSLFENMDQEIKEKYLTRVEKEAA